MRQLARIRKMQSLVGLTVAVGTPSNEREETNLEPGEGEDCQVDDEGDHGQIAIQSTNWPEDTERCCLSGPCFRQIVNFLKGMNGCRGHR